MKHSPEWQCWGAMRARCNNPRHHAFANYGGRGIRVCQEWESFEAFFRDMGPRPGPGYSLDRIDNDGNYEPGNCRWATRQEQERNKRSNTRVVFLGREMTLAEVADAAGMSQSQLLDRLSYGWSVERATKEPIRKYERKDNVND